MKGSSSQRCATCGAKATWLVLYESATVTIRLDATVERGEVSIAFCDACLPPEPV